MKIKKDIKDLMLVSFQKPEQGAILGSIKDTVTDFYYDIKGNEKSNKRYYEPDIESINIVLRKWALRGVSFCGIAHSHPVNAIELSKEDIKYGIKLCEAFALEQVLMPIEIPETCDIYYYYVYKNGFTDTALLYFV